ncbi:hypothetical protein LJC52_03480, partial [Bacteroidales bacterium OttesenSCG-928-A17]|nr:hypothetical protein [Bacteroidales bacterium OttesenSCG-928-A17]
HIGTSAHSNLSKFETIKSNTSYITPKKHAENLYVVEVLISRTQNKSKQKIVYYCLFLNFAFIPIIRDYRVNNHSKYLFHGK